MEGYAAGKAQGQGHRLKGLAWSLGCGVIAWELARSLARFPRHDLLLGYILLNSPQAYHRIVMVWWGLWFFLPFSVVYLGFAALHKGKKEPVVKGYTVSPFVGSGERQSLYVVLGEVLEDGEQQTQWLSIPEEGLYTGVAAIGSTGSGKTSHILHPLCEQLFGYRASDEAQKASGFVLEVKGDFCRHVRSILEQCGRGGDYLEIGPSSPWSYNPLNSSLSADEMASTVGDFIEQTFGESKEPFWRIAYTGLLSNAIKLIQLIGGHLTIRAVYRLMADQKMMQRVLEEAKRRVEGDLFYLFTKDTWRGREDILRKHGAEWDEVLDRYRAPYSIELDRYCRPQEYYSQARRKPVPFETIRVGGQQDEDSSSRIESIEFDLEKIWGKVKPETMTDIVLSCSNTLKLFDEPEMRRAFCPAEDAGNVLPRFTELIESGKVVGVNFPAATNPMVSRLVGIMAKLDYQRAVLSRMERGGKPRVTVFVCDEYQYFATVGENKPIGDDKWLSVNRQARCIPLLAYPSYSSLEVGLGRHWRSIAQATRNRLFFSASDGFTAEEAERLCGKDYRWRESYSVGQQEGDRRERARSGMSISASHALHLEPRFHVRDFTDLPTGQAIALIFDGRKAYAPCRVWLKPAYVPSSQRYAVSSVA